MKLLFKLLIAGLAVLCISPAVSFANGSYLPGYVWVASDGSQMIGLYNVRYNSGVTQGQVGVNVSATQVIISGVDSTTGRGFSCWVNSTDPLFAQAVNLAYAATNGSKINVWQSSNGCTNLSYQSGSNFLD